jgi:cell division protein FtsW
MYMWLEKLKVYIFSKVYKCLLSIDRVSLGILLLLISIAAFDLINSLHIIEIRLGIQKMVLFKKHLFFMGIFLFGILFLSTLTPKQNMIIASIVGVVAIILCILIIFIGTKLNGAKRWINLGFISLQPSVFIKNTIGIFLSFICKNLKEKLIVLGFACLIVLFQPDFGMCLLILATGMTEIFLMYDEEFKKYSYLILVIIGVLSIFLFFKGNYFICRVSKFFSNKGLYQSNIALYNMQNAKFFSSYDGPIIPDGHTDFIFASIVTNFGLFAGLIIIILYMLFFILNIQNGEKLPFKSKIILYCIISQIAYQSIFHITSNLNFIPPKGVSCPFISYGGSELLANIFSIGTLFSLTKKELKY